MSSKPSKAQTLAKDTSAVELNGETPAGPVKKEPKAGKEGKADKTDDKKDKKDKIKALPPPGSAVDKKDKKEEIPPQTIPGTSGVGN